MKCLICGAAHASCKGKAGEPMAIVDLPVPEPTDKSPREVTAEVDVFVDKTGSVVDAKDPAKLTKVISVGDRVSREKAARYGLLKPKEEPKAAGKVTAKVEEKKK